MMQSLNFKNPSALVLFTGNSPTGEHKLAEELPELCVEHCVDDGIDSAVDVPQPGDCAHQIGGDITRLTHGPGDVHYKEGCPAEQKRTCKQQGTDRQLQILDKLHITGLGVLFIVTV